MIIECALNQITIAVEKTFLLNGSAVQTLDRFEFVPLEFLNRILFLKQYLYWYYNDEKYISKL